ncbi:MAG: carbohydrate ABC transporter permease [Candidatus Omnitrophica bacterium]|nr:carbohydrate ABC transporter permease [Candidatus Omnitrophota bacterium]
MNRKILREGGHHLAMWAVALVMVLPFLWLLSSSLKTPEQVFSKEVDFIPDPIVWTNYTKSFEYMPVLLYTRNTVLITLLCTIGYLTSGSLVAYAFARIQWPGRDFLFIVLLATMMLPPQVTIVPLFVIFRHLGWIDTYYPLVVPSFLTGWPFFIFLLRQFFLSVPTELSEAAKVDGASHFQIYSRIILPLSKPALAVVAVFSFLLHWNDFFGPLIYLADDSKFTLALGLAVFKSNHPSEWGILMAVSALMLIPTILVFFFCQKYFVEGINLTGLKG